MKRIRIFKTSLLTSIALFSVLNCPTTSLAAIAITSPASGTANNTFTLGYSITETPLAGSVSLVFTSAGATRTI